MRRTLDMLLGTGSCKAFGHETRAAFHATAGTIVSKGAGGRAAHSAKIGSPRANDDAVPKCIRVRAASTAMSYDSR
jgi:hypothetical protein